MATMALCPVGSGSFSRRTDTLFTPAPERGQVFISILDPRWTLFLDFPLGCACSPEGIVDDSSLQLNFQFVPQKKF